MYKFLTPYCTECGKECDVEIIEESIDYEYWGSSGTHTTYEKVSDCCEAEIIEKKFVEEDE